MKSNKVKLLNLILSFFFLHRSCNRNAKKELSVGMYSMSLSFSLFVCLRLVNNYNFMIKEHAYSFTFIEHNSHTIMLNVVSSYSLYFFPSFFHFLSSFNIQHTARFQYIPSFHSIFDIVFNSIHNSLYF